MKREIKKGDKFGKLTALGVSEKISGKFYEECICECGKIILRRKDRLSGNKNSSCGCSNERYKKESKQINGNKYGRLFVTDKKEWKNGKERVYFVECLCECGNITNVRKTALMNGAVFSCGCLRLEKTIEKVQKHGFYKSRIYNILGNMKSRCYNFEHTSYKNYGARGITVCTEWMGENGFINFYNWSIKNGYRDDLTIDRIDNKKGYSPDNCRWATYKEQGRNKRGLVYLNIKKEVLCLTEVCEKYNLSYSTYQSRKKRGHDIEKEINKIIGD